MEGCEDNEKERSIDGENTIFVAVGKNVKESRLSLEWAVQSFPGKKICLLHVHHPTYLNSFVVGKLSANNLKQQEVMAFQELESHKVHKLLDQYRLILAEEGVESDNVWIEMNNIEGGIIKVIAQHNIRWLVMGAASDKYYSKTMAELKSKKAIFVCKQAPISCHIWFCCKGCLIYTRVGRKDEADIATRPPLLNPNSDVESEQLEVLSSRSVMNRQRSLNSPHAEEDGIGSETRLKRFNSMHSLHSTWPRNKVIGALRSSYSLPYEVEKTEVLEPGELYDKLQQAMVDAKRWKAEEDTMEAISKAEALEYLCTKEVSQREEMEEELERRNQEAETIKNQCEQLMEKLQMVRNESSTLESQFVESSSMVEELEEKIISAVELLISFKEKRDRMQLEHEKAISEVEKSKRLVRRNPASLCSPQFFAFTFAEINEATQNFDLSRKIGEGANGSLYQGILRHLHVAIKMLPSYGFQGHLEFQREVEALSRVRHPNLVMLIGACTEFRMLIYEFLRNGSLEDCLAHSGKTPALAWQTRMQIATEICSALIFLHSSKPSIIHGNLKPSKVLLGSNFVSKLSDLGISRLVRGHKNHTKDISVYTDPEFVESGELTPESDVYSFGVILLRLITGRPAIGVVKDVKCALEKGQFRSVLDITAEEWPLEQAKQLAYLALRCCEKNRFNRPDLVSEIWSVLEPLRASCNSPDSQMNCKEQRRTPSHFVCPIFQEVMKDPHIAADGFTYEADAIKGWLNSGHNTSPMTNLKLSHCNLIPNYALHYAIQEWQQQS